MIEEEGAHRIQYSPGMNSAVSEIYRYATSYSTRSAKLLLLN
jgi:hypothetical protein